jgi:hypothetical protein
MAGILVAGDIYIDRKDVNGNFTGLRKIGNVLSFPLTENADLKERTSKMKATYGQVLDSVAVKKPAKVSITVNELDKVNLALALLGQEAVWTQAAGAGLTKNVNLSAISTGDWIELGKKNIVADSVAATVSGSIILVEGTHYEINYDLGMISFLEAAPDAGAAVIEFDCAELTGFRVTGSVRPTIKARIVLDGINLADETRLQVEIHEAVLRPTEAIDFLAEDFASVGFEGSLNTPTGQASPYHVTNYQAA